MIRLPRILAALFFAALLTAPSALAQDAFTEARGYPPGACVDGIPLRDAVWFTITLD